MYASLTLHVELVGRRRRQSTFECGRADDLAVVVCLSGNDGQDGHDLTVALHARPVHLLRLLSVPGKLWRVGRAGVGDRTGEGVGLMFHGLVESAHQRFCGLICASRGEGDRRPVLNFEY